MRLIDAEKLIELVERSLKNNRHKEAKVRGNHTTEHEHFLSAIIQQPTAFDIDKVLEEFNKRIDPNVDMDTGEQCNNWVVDMQNELIRELGNIVLAGGVDSDPKR